jgi:hypothetical protein
MHPKQNEKNHNLMQSSAHGDYIMPTLNLLAKLTIIRKP